MEIRVQKHLKKVYGTLSKSMLAAAAGVYVHLFTNILSVSICLMQDHCWDTAPDNVILEHISFLFP